MNSTAALIIGAFLAGTLNGILWALLWVGPAAPEAPTPEAKAPEPVNIRHVGGIGSCMWVLADEDRR